MKLTAAILVGLLGALASMLVRGEEIGAVTTSINWLGANAQIVIDRFDDPKVTGAVCYVSRTSKGGLNPFVEQTSDASIACRQVGPVVQLKPGVTFKQGEDVFTEARSPLFKVLHVTRFFDKQKRVLVYISYSTKLYNGSPKHSISVIPVP